MLSPLDIKDINYESRILTQWGKDDILQKAMNKPGHPFTFYEGPPTANGMPHHGHIMTRVIKDLFLRYKTMTGYNVPRRAGWDTHGLPVEIEVEKSLNLDGKQDIENYGVDKFVQACKESVWKYKSEWEKLTNRIGYWIDMEKPYVTHNDTYVEEVWFSLSQIHKKGLLYKGHKVLPWCPKDMTALSSHEVGQGYKEVNDPAIAVAFQLENENVESYLVAWTTTPWTLPSNVALAINPDMNYAYVKKDEKVYIIASNNVNNFYPEADVVGVVKGYALVGKKYKPLYKLNTKASPACVVLTAPFVTDGGTGVVHIAPAYGEDDYQLCKDNNIDLIDAVGPDGLFQHDVLLSGGQMIGGTWFKDANQSIIRDLKNRGILIKHDQTKHEYPHCWRCKTPLMYYARSAWFIKTTNIANRMDELNQKIQWIPDHVKSGRFGDFLKNNKDWCISRERYWGTPLPIWECKNNHVFIPEDAQDLKEWFNIEVTDLHRPNIDDVKFPCYQCSDKSEMTRVKEVLDCWYDSGAMPFAQSSAGDIPWSRGRSEPADFICEGIDQTRGWFYTLHAISTLLNDRPAYNRCVVLGHVLDENGKKYSKHLKNYKSPDEILDVYGADALRWFFYTNMVAGEPIKFYESGVKDARNFLLKIQHTYNFFCQYAKIDGFNVNSPKPERTLIDRWILSRLYSTTAAVKESLDSYNWHMAANSIELFVDDLSNWFVRRSRPRAWSSATPDNQAKWALWWTMYDIFRDLSKIMAPFTPFLAEELYQAVNQTTDSVHLDDFPILMCPDLTLESEMKSTREVVNLGLKIRAENRIKVKRVLPKVIICASNNGVYDKYQDLIKDELNVKDLVISNDLDNYVHVIARPNFKVIGPRFGPEMTKLARLIVAADVKDLVLHNRPIQIEWNDSVLELGWDEINVEFKAKPGFASSSSGSQVVVLDTNAEDPELENEYILRELQAAFQNMRKSLQLSYDFKIYAGIAGDQEMISPIKDRLANGILARTLEMRDRSIGVSTGVLVRNLQINNSDFELSIWV